MSIIMTAAGYRQLQPRNCIKVEPDNHPDRRPLREYAPGKFTTQAAIDYSARIRAEVNGSRAQRNLPLLPRDKTYDKVA